MAPKASTLGTVGVFISNAPIGFHISGWPLFVSAEGGKGLACVIEQSRYPFGNTKEEVRPIEDELGFPLVEADRIVIYIEHGTFAAVENLIKAGVSGERITLVTCKHNRDDVRVMLDKAGLWRTELITDHVECGGMQMMETLIERFRFDLKLHD
ncbi:MAG: hypothetical protein WAV25_01380 [Minisyncoccia bacterium]